jgi:HSP20 family protein
MSGEETKWFAQAALPGGFARPLSARWSPAADIYRTREGWLIKLELAGVAKDDVQLTVRGNTLIVRGRRRDTLLSEGSEQFRLEISYSEFERRIELPCDLTQAQLSAEFREGMLLIRVLPGAQG